MAQTLYAYVDGCDLHEIADDLHLRFVSFVSHRRWTCSDAWAVNDRQEPDPAAAPEDLPVWHLGLNVALPELHKEPRGWFGDIEAIADFLGELHRSTGRTFVIGIADAERNITEDLFYVDSAVPDLATLRAIIGVGEQS